MIVSQPRMSLPLGQFPVHGGRLSTYRGRRDDIWEPLAPPAMRADILLDVFFSFFFLRPPSFTTIGAVFPAARARVFPPTSSTSIL